MNCRPLLRILPLLIVLLLSACGNKGPLVLPPKPSDAANQQPKAS